MEKLELKTKQVCDLARDVGHFIKNEMGNLGQGDLESKGVHDYVTYVDKTSERKLVEGLTKILPQSGFIVEEQTVDRQSDDYNWIIDPLDGTTNFIHSVPVFSVSIALQKQGKTVMGVVYEIMQDECFYSHEGAKAYLNDQEIRVSSADKLDNSLLATGFPFADFSKLDGYMEFFKHLMQHSRGLRRLGSAAVDLAYTACGRFEGFYEYSLKPWDVAAGAYIVQQAGGKVCDFKGGDNYLYGGEIIATNPGIYQEFMEAVKRFFSH
ncbi:MAG: inositol monophosphatase [Bacteroidales bacterium]|nr:inositol monophosphatase [Bacteroidales bacterium]